jgi:hypothetical protein
MAPCDVVGPSPRSGEAEAPPRSRLSPGLGVGRGGDRRLRSRLILSPGGQARWRPSSEVEAESEPGGRARRRPPSGVEAESELRGRAKRSPSSEVEVESEPWGRARRSPSSEVEVESEPWGRARQSFLWRLRPVLAAVSLTRGHSSRSSADGAVFLSGQPLEGRSDCGHFGLVN